MSHAVFSELAEGDLAEIWVAIALDSIEAAERFIEELRDKRGGVNEKTDLPGEPTRPEERPDRLRRDIEEGLRSGVATVWEPEEIKREGRRGISKSRPGPA